MVVSIHHTSTSLAKRSMPLDQQQDMVLSPHLHLDLLLYCHPNSHCLSHHLQSQRLKLLLLLSQVSCFRYNFLLKFFHSHCFFQLHWLSLVTLYSSPCLSQGQSSLTGPAISQNSQ